MYKKNPTIRTVRRNVYVNDSGGGSSSVGGGADLTDRARLPAAAAAARPDRVVPLEKEKKRFIGIERKKARSMDGIHYLAHLRIEIKDYHMRTSSFEKEGCIFFRLDRIICVFS